MPTSMVPSARSCRARRSLLATARAGARPARRSDRSRSAQRRVVREIDVAARHQIPDRLAAVGELAALEEAQVADRVRAADSSAARRAARRRQCPCRSAGRTPCRAAVALAPHAEVPRDRLAHAARARPDRPRWPDRSRSPRAAAAPAAPCARIARAALRATAGNAAAPPTRYTPPSSRGSSGIDAAVAQALEQRARCRPASARPAAARGVDSATSSVDRQRRRARRAAAACSGAAPSLASRTRSSAAARAPGAGLRRSPRTRPQDGRVEVVAAELGQPSVAMSSKRRSCSDTRRRVEGAAAQVVDHDVALGAALADRAQVAVRELDGRRGRLVDHAERLEAARRERLERQLALAGRRCAGTATMASSGSSWRRRGWSCSSSPRRSSARNAVTSSSADVPGSPGTGSSGESAAATRLIDRIALGLAGGDGARRVPAGV